MSDERPSVRAVLERLRAAGLAGPDVLEASARQLAAAGRTAPWYIAGLVGVGAWLAALFLLGALWLLLDLLVRGRPPLAPVGLALTAAGLFLARAARGLFFAQLALAFCLAGQLLVVAGTDDLLRGADRAQEQLVLSMVAALQGLVLYVLHGSALHRFLCALLALVTIAVVVAEHRWEEDVGYLQQAYACVLALGMGGLGAGAGAWARETWRPLGRALAAALVVVLCMLCSEGSAANPRFGKLQAFWDPTCIALGAVLVLTVLRAAGGPREIFREPVALAVGGVLALALLASPGILAALLLLVLGAVLEDRLLVAGGFLTLPLFLFLYYYTLEVTLLYKSGTLAGSGLLLLAAAAYLGRRPWAREEA